MYSSDTSYVQNIANEQTIANMIRIIETPELAQHFNKEELVRMLEAIKLHLSVNAELILQDKHLNKRR